MTYSTYSVSQIDDLKAHSSFIDPDGGSTQIAWKKEAKRP